MYTLFIHTNHKQLFGAKLGKYSFEKEAGSRRNFEVRFIIAEDLPEMQAFVGTRYISTPGDERTYTFDDLQSFTMTRFKAPELMGYQGRAIVIDPDIFALPGTNIGELFAMDLQGADIACVQRQSGKWETSLMVLDCAKLTHWRLADILQELKERTKTKNDFMLLKKEKIHPIPEVWNSLDSLVGAKILHTTRRQTQPWKTGLPIDFTPKPLPKLFGIIPREPIHKLLGKYPTHFTPHPDKAVIDFFFTLVKKALQDGVVTHDDITREIEMKNVRPDMLTVLAQY